MSFCISRSLNRCKDLLSAYLKKVSAQELQMSFSSAKIASQLSGCITSAGVKGVLKGKDYGADDDVFPFNESFLDKARGCGNNPDLGTVYKL